jgi:hypothetical protein
MEILKNSKIGRARQISKQEAVDVLKEGYPYNSYYELVEEYLTNPWFSEERGVKNLRFDFEKIGRRGRTEIIGGHPYGKVKAELGEFKITLCWDFISPHNFSQNENGLQKDFTVLI